MGQARVILHDFKHVRPAYQLPQEQLLVWLEAAYGAELSRLVRRYACPPEKILTRGTDLPEFAGADGQAIYRDAEGKLRHPSTSERTHLFAQIATERTLQLLRERTRPPQHLVHVTCTGYTSPSPAQLAVELKGWNGRTAVTHFYHMGCYAAMPAIRFARAMALQNHDWVTDVVHTEICSLHLDLQNQTPEQIVIQSLFGDGYIRYSVGVPPMLSFKGYVIDQVEEFLIPNSSQLMNWHVGNFGFEMGLDRDVPRVLAEHVEGFLSRLYLGTGLKKENCLFAIHPGGPKIIDMLVEKLRLREDQVDHSRAVLRNFGNMSSATLPHVWQRLLEDDGVASGQAVVSLAFGPGLTVFGSTMRKFI